MPKKYPAPYTLHPLYDCVASGLVNLRERTGKTMKEWARIVESDGPKTEKEQAEWLKVTHGLTTNDARRVAEWAAGKGSPNDYDPQELFNDLFAGPKHELKTRYDCLIEVGRSTKMSSLVHARHLFHSFGTLSSRRSNRRRRPELISESYLRKTADLPAGLIGPGGTQKGDRITHKIEVTSASDIDDFLNAWLKFAYDLDAI